jgi:penicillin V acylase-like amidase (Ntn superfamily)
MKPSIIFQSFRLVLAAATVCFSASPSARACTRVLWNDNQLAVLVGRTMDWPTSTMPILTVLPRVMERDGSRLGPDFVVKDNGLKWTSKYGSLITPFITWARPTG